MIWRWSSLISARIGTEDHSEIINSVLISLGHWACCPGDCGKSWTQLKLAKALLTSPADERHLKQIQSFHGIYRASRGLGKTSNSGNLYGLICFWLKYYLSIINCGPRPAKAPSGMHFKALTYTHSHPYIRNPYITTKETIWLHSKRCSSE